MPVTVRKSGSRWEIVEADTGRVVGHSDSEKAAQASAAIRNAYHRRKQQQGQEKRGRGR